MRKRGFTLIELMIVVAILGIVLTFSGIGISSCATSGDDAARAAEKLGFSEPRVGSKIYFARVRGCASENVGFTMEATNPRGQRVDILVCCDFRGYCTTRAR